MCSPGIAAISPDSPRLWVFTLEARPLHDSPDFAEAGGAFITCYLRPGFAPDPMRRAVEFVALFESRIEEIFFPDVT